METRTIRATKTKYPGIYRLIPSRRFPDGGWKVRYRSDGDHATQRTFATFGEAIAFQRAVRSARLHPKTEIHRLRKGAISETRAVTWLLEQGYEVFPNVAGTGPVDMVAIKWPLVHLVDVKSQYSDRAYPRANSRLTLLQQKMGVRLLVVTLNGDCFWEDEFSTFIKVKTEEIEEFSDTKIRR